MIRYWLPLNFRCRPDKKRIAERLNCVQVVKMHWKIDKHVEEGSPLGWGGGGRGLDAMGTQPMAAARAKGSQAATEAMLGTLCSLEEEEDSQWRVRGPGPGGCTWPGQSSILHFISGPGSSSGCVGASSSLCQDRDNFLPLLGSASTGAEVIHWPGWVIWYQENCENHRQDNDL